MREEHHAQLRRFQCLNPSVHGSLRTPQTTPGPASTRYAVSLTTMAVAGSDRSGSGGGSPVPKSTPCVRGGVVVGACWPAANEARIVSETKVVLRGRTTSF